MEVDLEPRLASVPPGTIVDVVLRPMWIGPNTSLASTSIHGTSVLLDVVLPNTPSATVFQGRVEFRGNRVWICKMPSTVVMGHSAIRERDFQYMRETCAGLGAVSTGFAKCGVVTSVYNDVNKPFTDDEKEWKTCHFGGHQRHQGSAIHGASSRHVYVSRHIMPAFFVAWRWQTTT